MFVVPTAPPAANSTCNSSQAPSCMVYSVPLSSSGSYNLPSASSLSSILQIPVTSSGLVTFGQKVRGGCALCSVAPLSRLPTLTLRPPSSPPATPSF